MHALLRDQQKIWEKFIHKFCSSPSVTSSTNFQPLWQLQILSHDSSNGMTPCWVLCFECTCRQGNALNRIKNKVRQGRHLEYSTREGFLSGMSEIAACLLSPFADNPSALPFPTSFPFSNQYLFWPIHLIPVSVCQPFYWTTVFFKVLYCKIKAVVFTFYVVFMYYLCKSIIKLLHYSTM